MTWSVCRVSEQVAVRHHLSQRGRDTCQSGVQKATCSKGQSQGLARQEDSEASTGHRNKRVRALRLSPECKPAPALPW